MHKWKSNCYPIVIVSRLTFHPAVCHNSTKMIQKLVAALIVYLFYAGPLLGQSSLAKPFVLGEIREIQSLVLGENRLLNIYLPESYHTGDTSKYPVVYLLDGSADEDFIHIAGLYQFNSFSWIERVHKSIVVGIANVDRRRDFTFPTSIEKDKARYPSTGKSAQFIAFLEKELQPFIEKNYSVSDSKTIIGQSLGGLLATEILLTRPTLFNKYIIVSPSLWWNNGSLLGNVPFNLLHDLTTQIQVYIGVGKEGLVPGNNKRVMEADAKQLAQTIKAASNAKVKVFFDYMPREGHASILHQAVYNALRCFAPGSAAH